MYWCRLPGLVEASTRKRWRLQRITRPGETYLNAAAISVWEQCNGKSVSEIVAALSRRMKDSPSERQVAETLTELSCDGLVRNQKEDGYAPILRVRIDRIPHGSNEVREYLQYALTDHFAVLAVGDGEPADVVFVWMGADNAGFEAIDNRTSEECLYLAVTKVDREYDGFDAVIRISDRFDDTEIHLAGWVFGVNWNPSKNEVNSIHRLRQSRAGNQFPFPGWGLVELGGNRADQSLVQKLRQGLGAPKILYSRFLDPGVAYRGEGRVYSFVFITGDDLSVYGSASVVDAWLLGAVPIYDGASTALPVFNNHAIIFTGDYPDSASAIEYALWLYGNPDYYHKVHEEPLLAQLEGSGDAGVIGPGDPRLLGEKVWATFFSDESGQEAGVKDAGTTVVNEARRVLTIGMASFDDYDGVYFSLEAIRLYHPEILDRCQFIILDNNPGSEIGAAIKALAEQTGNCRYLPVTDQIGTAVRDRIFREAETDYVLCMDSHVMLQAGSLARLIEYMDNHPDCRDLLQGPMLSWDIKKTSSHFEPGWGAGMYGTWASDPRAEDPDNDPFEIEMQGLGVFACRRNAWLGFNYDFRGFGGEEGYIHEKYHRSGNRTLCLPFLRWTHRFGRPSGSHYPNLWEDRIRNYLLGFSEVGLATNQVEEHFADLLNPEVVWNVARAVDDERRNPFSFFQALYCINLSECPRRWESMQERFQRLGIERKVRRFEAVSTPHNSHIGCGLSHRRIIETARKLDLECVMVFEDDAIFRRGLLFHLERCVAELKELPWRIFLLGGVDWSRRDRTLQGRKYVEDGTGITTTHAVAYHRRCYNDLLDILPQDESQAMLRLESNAPLSSWVIDRCIAAQTEEVYLAKPLLATQIEHRSDLPTRDLKDFFID